MVGRIVGRRLLQLVPVMLGVSFITFVVLNLLPGDTAVALLGTNATAQNIATLRRQLHLNEPLLTRYGHWVGGLVTGNLGHSATTQQSVTTILAQRVPVTAELLVLALIIALVLAVPVAVLAAHKPKGVFDKVGGTVAMLGLSVPNFLVALLLILFLAVKLSVFPATGFTPLSQGIGANLRTMILPALAMSFALFATYTRVLRADMVGQIATEEYVTAARSKGLSQWSVLLHHVLRNSLFSLITVVGVNFGTLLGASVVIEDVFALPGVGQMLMSSIYNRDVTVVQGIVVVMAVVVVCANLVADLLYTVLDPRVRYGSAGA